LGGRYLAAVGRRHGGVFAAQRGGRFVRPAGGDLPGRPAGLASVAFVPDDRRRAEPHDDEWIRIEVAAAAGGALLVWEAWCAAEVAAPVLAHLRRALTLAERFEEALGALDTLPAKAAAIAAEGRLDEDSPCCATHGRLRARLSWLEGEALLRLGATRPARIALREAVRLDPDLHHALAALARLEERTSELPEADAWFRELAVRGAGSAQGALGAAGAVRVGRRLESESPETMLLEHARASRRADGAEDELLALTLAVQACPSDPTALAALARCHERHGRHRDAMEAWLACLLRAPLDAQALLGLARSEQFLGRSAGIERSAPWIRSRPPPPR
jgi:tetratricopeptide (TPR) repeat protein